MRGLMFLVVMVAAIVVIILYLQRVTRVPGEVRTTLGDSVRTMQQIGGAVKDRVDRDLQGEAKQYEDAMKEAEK
jgi:cell shape-determining protein MreC